MKPLYLLIVDLPLHSSHATFNVPHTSHSSSSSASTFDYDSTWSYALRTVNERLEEMQISGRPVFVAILLYSSPSHPECGVIALPWTSARNAKLLKLSSPIAPRDDPYEVLAALATKIPAHGVLDLVWILPSTRIMSAPMLSYRLCQTMRYLLDLRRGRRQVLIEENQAEKLPASFLDVFSSLQIDVSTNYQLPDNPDQVEIDLRLDSPVPFSSESITMTIFEGTTIRANYWPNAQPLALQLVSALPRDTIPIHLLDGLEITGSLYSTEPHTLEGSPFTDLILRAVLRPTSSHLPTWDEIKLRWEYPSDVSLPLGDPYLFRLCNGSVSLRRIKLDTALVFADISSSGPLQSPWFMSNRAMHQETFPLTSRVQGLTSLWVWIFKQARMSLITLPSDMIALESMGEASSIASIAKWYQTASLENRETFAYHCSISTALLCRYLQSSLVNSRLNSHHSEERNSSDKPKEDSQMEVDDSDSDDNDIQFGEEIDIDMDQIPVLPFPKLADDNSSWKVPMESSSTPSLSKLWNRELNRFSSLEATSVGAQSPLTASSSRYFDDSMSVASSESGNDHGLELLGLVRSRGELTSSNNSNSTSSSSSALKRPKTSKQLRQQLSSLTKPPKVSLETVIGSLNSSAPEIQSLQASSSPRMSTATTFKRSPAGTKSTVTSKKLPPLASPTSSSSPSKLLLSHSNPIERASPRAPKLAPLVPTRSPSPGPVAVSPSTSSAANNSNNSSKSPANETDNANRLTACCQAEVSRVIPATDRRFKDLVQRLFHISKILITVKYDWDTIIPNSELVQRVQEQAKQLLLHT